MSKTQGWPDDPVVGSDEVWWVLDHSGCKCNEFWSRESALFWLEQTTIGKMIGAEIVRAPRCTCKAIGPSECIFHGHTNSMDESSPAP